MAIAHLRSLPGRKQMTLVALTGWGQDQHQNRTREAGFDRHLLKPIDPTELNGILVASPKSCRRRYEWVHRLLQHG